MAVSCAPLPPAGGYECDFVDPVSETLSCAVCLLPFRDPHLVSCCGAKYCGACIDRVKAAGQPCPLCKQDFNTMLERSLQRRVLELKARCSRTEVGCKWVDELRHLDHHETEECGWAVVECSYQCGAHLPRRLMAEHKRDVCPQRPMDVKLEWFMKSVETKLTTERERHEREMAAVREEFRNTLTTHKKEVKELKQLLAEQKREMENKIAEQLMRQTESKMAEQKETESKMAELKRQAESKEMKDEYTSKIAMMEKSLLKKMEEEIKSILISSHPLSSIEFTMTQYSTHRENSDNWYSRPFYTGPGGYKMCIRVVTNGRGSGAGSHVSVYVHLMRGEYDSRLVWPFRGDITIQLVNHNSNIHHHEWTVYFGDAADGRRVTSREKADYGRGCNQFISHTTVESSTVTSRYVVDDCLTFRITKIVVHSV